MKKRFTTSDNKLIENRKTLNMFEFASFSIRNPEKPKCGDASFSNTMELNGEPCAVLIVADGVSRAPKDWLASQSTVNFIEGFLKNYSFPIPELMQRAVAYSNEKIINGVQNTFGMLTTLVLLIYQPSSKKAYWVNVGDSRVYGLSNGKWTQLSTDDSTSQPYMENGKMRLRNGQPIMVSALTRAIGARGSLDIKVHEVSATSYSAFLLCSDGFYGVSEYDSLTIRMCHSADLAQDSKLVSDSIVKEITDDASVALIRFSQNLDLDIRNLVCNPKEESQSLSAFSVRNALEPELENAIKQRDDQYVGDILIYMDDNRIYFNRERMIRLLEMMIAVLSVHQGRMISMIKRLPYN